MAGSFSLPTVLANLAAGNEALSLIDGDFTACYNPLVSLNSFSNYYADTGAANAYVVTVSSPQTVSQTAGLAIQFLATNANTGASTLQINALAVKSITHLDGSALVAGDIPAAGLVSVIYDGTQYQLQNKGKASALEAITPLTAAAGTNTVTATASPTFSAYAAGQKFALIPAGTNTGATTLNINSVGAKNVFSRGAACVGGEIEINVPCVVEYDGTQFNIIGGWIKSGVVDISAPTLGQIKFPATQNASANANTLDDYSEGTWTPSFTNLTVVNGTGGATYTGYFLKIGRLVFCKWAISVTGTCTTASTANSTNISNLPFTVDATVLQSSFGVADGNIASLGIGLFYNGTTAYTPTWSARNIGVFGSGVYYSNA